MLLGEEFGAAQAQAWGLVWQVTPDSELQAAARATAERLARLSPKVVATFKKVLNEIGLGSFQRALCAESEAQRQLGNTAP
jgi:2-(1,2-epoxy-1,2-dihydrophenyl)acetyl-CoA isomerase